MAELKIGDLITFYKDPGLFSEPLEGVVIKKENDLYYILFKECGVLLEKTFNKEEIESMRVKKIQKSHFLNIKDLKEIMNSFGNIFVISEISIEKYKENNAQLVQYGIKFKKDENEYELFLPNLAFWQMREKNLEDIPFFYMSKTDKKPLLAKYYKKERKINRNLPVSELKKEDCKNFYKKSQCDTISYVTGIDILDYCICFKSVTLEEGKEQSSFYISKNININGGKFAS